MVFYSVINSVAIKIGPMTIHWYGIIIGLAVFLALFLAMREAEHLGINPDYFVDVVMFGLPAAIIGARLYYVLFRWEHYSQFPGEIMAIWHGGLAIHGGLIGALLAAYIYTRVKKISFWLITDVAAPSLLIGQAIGRWGNFINQEAHGGPITERTQWIIDILPRWIAEQMNINGVYYHPTFLYESAWNIVGVLLIMFWLRRQDWVRRGEVFFAYAMWYSVGRFFIEALRTDSLMLTETLRIAQVISIVIIIGAAALIWFRRVYGLSDKKYGEE